ncbi:PspC domain-containing protein [Mariniflexile sp. HMF6888]|uniref:PspC domain-containing protein n=1 Tax=Mariniflexile sp. HMF6888 TaxID=3373086 RepID=UPI0037A180D1
MNKTVNINLAGTFFHIDEDAYLKLQRYLEAIKRSFTDSQGRTEIIADIETRIAELFSERVQNDKQVIRIKEVDEVISIMGQPEDYLVDDEIFEDEPQSSYQRKSSGSKKLFRDTDNSYIGGVASGLGYYLGIDAVWVRLLWILFTVGSGGTFIFIYILFWILVPEAKTTAEKIMMTGEPVNISNIEKKIKDGFDTVSETVSDVAKNVTDSVSGAAKNVSDAAKKVDLQKQGSRIKSNSKSFFDTLADIIMFFLKIFAKFIGIILIIVGAFALISLIIGWFSLGVADIIHIPGMDFVNIAIAGNSPVWLVSLLAFFAIGIPFFFLFYLGLKILVTNLKSIGNIAKFTLLGLWLFSIIGLIVIGFREVSEHAFNERVMEKQTLFITANDTLEIKMAENDLLRNRYHRHDSFKVANNENGEKTIYSSDISIIVKSTTDSLATISIEKSADGRNYDKAIECAKNIHYNYALKGNMLQLDSYLSTDAKNKFSDQEIVVVLYLPEGSVVKFSNNTRRYLNHNMASNYMNHYLNVTEDDLVCNDCDDDEFEIDVDIPNVKIDESGIEIKGDKSSLKIDDNGINAESEDVKVNINSEGVSVKSEN